MKLFYFYFINNFIRNLLYNFCWNYIFFKNKCLYYLKIIIIIQWSNIHRYIKDQAINANGLIHPQKLMETSLIVVYNNDFSSTVVLNIVLIIILNILFIYNIQCALINQRIKQFYLELIEKYYYFTLKILITIKYSLCHSEMM